MISYFYRLLFSFILTQYFGGGIMITKEMNIIEVVNNYPESVEVFTKYGMGCFGCMAARFENIEQGAQAHGIDVDALINDLNEATK